MSFRRDKSVRHFRNCAEVPMTDGRKNGEKLTTSSAKLLLLPKGHIKAFPNKSRILELEAKKNIILVGFVSLATSPSSLLCHKKDPFRHRRDIVTRNQTTRVICFGKRGNSFGSYKNRKACTEKNKCWLRWLPPMTWHYLKECFW